MVLKFIRLLACLAASAILGPAAAQTAPTWDTSGNSLLNGNYFFRQVLYSPSAYGGLNQAVSIYGTITFDSTKGTYALQGTVLDSNYYGSTQPFQTTGTYGISSAGLGSISNPYTGVDAIYGLVTQGIFIGSSTESQSYNDLLIAVPAGAAAATNTLFQGSYWVAHMDIPSGNPADFRDAFFQLNPDGQGHVAGVNATGYIGGAGNTAIAQSIQGVTYSFNNGVGTLSLPGTLTTQNLLAGNKLFYLSPDGNFFVGGAPDAWDIFVGIRAVSGTATNDLFSGLYYQAGIDQDLSQGANAPGYLDTYFGALSAAAGRLVGQQRLSAPAAGSAYDYTYNGSYALGADGTYDLPTEIQKYAVGAGGTARVGIGKGPYLGISVALQAPRFSGPGVFLNPAGVVNAASSAPFTTGIARGELITLYGTGLAPRLDVASTLPFPQNLNGVQVTVNSRPAPVYYVSPTQVSVIVPYGTTEPIAQIQVNNNGSLSNVATVWVNTTAPGVFTVPPGGLGYGAVLHSDYSLVTAANPAKPGETLAVYVTGLGDVSPSISDGAPGPSNPFSQTVNPISFYIGGVQAKVTYSGLAPTLAGLYQINIQVPSNVSSGDQYLDVSGPDSYSSEAQIPVAGPGGPAAVPRHVSPRARRSPRSLDRRALTRP